MFVLRKLIAYILLLLLPVVAYANNGDTMERQEQFMAVYLLHFSNFIEWPQTSFKDDKYFNICISANSKLNRFANELNGESVKDRFIKVSSPSSSAQTEHCQILFVDKDSTDIFEPLQGSNILLVGNQPGFSKSRGSIEYFTENNKLRIAINIEITKSNGLTISSKLLRIAKVVE